MSWCGSNDRRAWDHRPRFGSTLAILKRNSDQARAGLDMKKVRRTKVEQIKRIINGLILLILVSDILLPGAPNNKDGAGEHGTMCVTSVRNISAGLQESCGEIPCRDHI